MPRFFKKREKAEASLQESERRFRETLENISLVAVSLDKQGNIIFCNDFLLSLSGWQRRELLGRNWFDTFTGFEPKVKQVFLEGVQQGIVPARYENQIITQAGEKRMIAWSNTILRDLQGNIAGITSIGDDITERRQMEKMLKESDARSKAMYQAIPDLMFRLDRQGIFLDYKADIKDLYAQSTQTIIGKPVREITPPEFSDLIERQIRTTLETNMLQVFEYKLLKPDHGIRDYEARMVVSGADEVTATVRDITGRKRSEEALDLIRTNLELALQSSKTGVWQYHIIESKLCFDNQVCALLGIDPLNYNKSVEHFFAVIHPDDHQKVTIAFAKTIEQKVPFETEYRVIWSDGRVHYISARGKLSLDDDGNAQAINGIIWNITERKLSEEALQESEELYRTLVLKLPDGVYKSTHEGKFIDVNPAMVNMLGYSSKEELMAIDIKTQLYFDPSDRESLILQEKLEEMGIYRLRKKDGSAIWVEDHGWYNLDINGNTLSHEGILRDITERKQMEEELAWEQYLMQTLMDNLPDHIYFKDLESRFFSINKSHAHKFGLDDPDNAVGKSDFDFFSEEHANQAYNDEQTIIRTGQPLRIEEKETYQNRSDTWASTIKMPLFDKEGKVMGTFGTSRDITRQKLIEKEIRVKNEELQKLNAEKDKFFSIIAHDLRNPLGSFMGYTELMLDELDNMSIKEIQSMAADMKKSACNLYDLLENLLEWSKIERGITGFDPKSFLLLPKITESIQSVLDTATKKGVEIGLNVPDDMVVYADENMLKSTIRNLATNAVKFTNKGGRIILTAKSAHGNFVEISFKDTGIGMNKDILDKLFRLDAQISRPGTEGEPSSGLGLILCRDFINKHGGKLWVESEPGKGSVFYFTIPNNQN